MPAIALNLTASVFHYTLVYLSAAPYASGQELTHIRSSFPRLLVDRSRYYCIHGQYCAPGQRSSNDIKLVRGPGMEQMLAIYTLFTSLPRI